VSTDSGSALLQQDRGGEAMPSTDPFRRQIADLLGKEASFPACLVVEIAKRVDLSSI
jgi:hypothetical protein